MKKHTVLFATLAALASALAAVAQPVTYSGWNTTTNAATARAALKVPSFDELTAPTGHDAMQVTPFSWARIIRSSFLPFQM